MSCLAAFEKRIIEEEKIKFINCTYVITTAMMRLADNHGNRMIDFD